MIVARLERFAGALVWRAAYTPHTATTAVSMVKILSHRHKLPARLFVVRGSQKRAGATIVLTDDAPTTEEVTETVEVVETTEVTVDVTEDEETGTDLVSEEDGLAVEER